MKVLEPLFNLNISIPPEFSQGLSTICSGIGFFLPVEKLMPLLTITASYYALRVIMHIVRFVVNLIPTVEID